MAVQYIPGPATGAQIEKDGENWTLILVRELNHPRERVWEALTDPQSSPIRAPGRTAAARTNSRTLMPQPRIRLI